MTSILRRRLPLFFAVFTICLCIGLAFLALQVPLYRASSEVVPPNTAAGSLDTAMKLIRSRAMARDVALALNLDRDPAFLQSAQGTSPLARLRELAGMNRTQAAPAGSPAALATASERLAGSISVTRPADTVSLLIGYTARSPQLAARIANEYARQYARRQLADPAAQGGSVRILAEAEPPLSPITLRPIPILLASIGCGLLLGLLAAILRERSFRGITSGGEIEARTGLHHLGTVPLVTSVLKDAHSPVDAIVASPRSGFAESFRSLRTSIRIAGGEQAQVVAITSTQAGDGTTTVAACLARTIALSGDTVLLVDCTPNGQGATSILSLNPGPDLAAVAAGEATLEEALIRDEVSGAYVATCSSAEDPRHLGPLIDQLRQRFSHILVDAPAVSAGETTALPELTVDLVVIAAKWRSTPDRAVRKVAEALAAADLRVGGVTLTQVDMHRQVKYVHDDESNYYAKLSKYYS